MFNKVILIGRLGKNAEAKTAQNKKDYAVLSIATSESWKNDKGEYETRTEWHRVYAWGNLATFAKNALEGPARQPGGEDQVSRDRRNRQGPAGQVHHRRDPRFQHPASLEGRSR